MNRNRAKSCGLSLIEALLATAIFAICGMVVLEFTSSQSRAVSDLENMSDINAMRQRITKSLSCSQTLEYKGTTLSCASKSNLVPKTVDNQEMIFGSGAGEWLIRGYCISDEIIFKVTKGPKRKKGVQDWTTTKFGTDLYLGVSDFCREYFDPNLAPPALTAGVYVISNDKTKCFYPNLVTNSCSCPPGYLQKRSLEFHDEECAVDFFDLNYVGPCKVDQYLCYRFP